MDNKIIIIVGHTGSGKTTIAKELGERKKYHVMGFSHAGKELAKVSEDIEECNAINDYITSCIVNMFTKMGTVIIDGLASIDVLHELLRKKYNTSVIYIETPLEERLERIAKRQQCSLIEACEIERIKATGKRKAGINCVIDLADIKFDGREATCDLVNEIINYLEEQDAVV